MNAIEQWKSLSEEEKIDKVLNIAFQSLYDKILNLESSSIDGLEEYLALNKAMLEWLVPKVGMQGFPFYYGPDVNSANNT